MVYEYDTRFTLLVWLDAHIIADKIQLSNSFKKLYSIKI